MRRSGSRKTGRLLLLLLCGIIVGSIVGYILSLYIHHPMFTQTVDLGTSGPITLNLTAFTLVLGFTVHVNFGTVLGVIIGLVLYFRS